MKSISEESLRQKAERLPKTLVSVKPGSYMVLHANKMKRVMLESQGLLVGSRVEDDNHKIVLVDEELILVPRDKG